MSCQEMLLKNDDLLNTRPHFTSINGKMESDEKLESNLMDRTNTSNRSKESYKEELLCYYNDNETNNSFTEKSFDEDNDWIVGSPNEGFNYLASFSTNNDGNCQKKLRSNNLGVILSLNELINPFKLNRSTNCDENENLMFDSTNIFINCDQKSLSVTTYESSEIAEYISTDTNEEFITPSYINKIFNATSMISVKNVSKIIKDEPIEILKEEFDTTSNGKNSVPMYDFWDDVAEQEPDS
jgi:hypothetical protein